MRYITPEHCIRSRLGDRPAPKWPVALLVFRDQTGSQAVLDAFDPIRPVGYRLLYNLTGPSSEPLVFEADVGGQRIALVTRCVWGGPQTAIVVEELGYLGVPLILGYGVAGAIDPCLRQGDFVVADAALPTDGTSRAYGAEVAQSADAALADAAAAAIEQANNEATRVQAAQVDALYRETPALVEDLRARGGQIVNLETATLYAVSAACGVRAVWLGYVSDCLTDGKWDDWFVDLGDRASTAATVCRDLVATVLTG